MGLLFLQILMKSKKKMILPFPFNVPFLLIFTFIKYVCQFLYEFLTRIAPLGNALSLPAIAIEKIAA